MITAAAKLLELVKKRGGEWTPPASEEEIRSVEERLECPLPTGLRSFYRIAGEASISESMWCFFSLRSLELFRDYRNTTTETLRTRGGVAVSTDSLVIFADALIDCPSYWMRIDPSSPFCGHVFCDGDFPIWHVAESYDAFVEAFLRDPEEIFINFES